MIRIVAVTESGSLNTVDASSKVIPCLAKFSWAFSSPHSNFIVGKVDTHEGLGLCTSISLERSLNLAEKACAQIPLRIVGRDRCNLSMLAVRSIQTPYSPLRHKSKREHG
jgi:hypothetical protein